MAGSSYGVKRSGSRIGPRYKRRRMSIPSRGMRMSIPVTKFKRTFWAANWAFSTASTIGFYRLVAPVFSDLPNVTEYTNLFDVYKVKGVKVTFVPRFGDVNVNADNTSTPVIYNNQMYLTVATNTTELTIPTGTYGNSAYNDMVQRGDDVKIFKLDKPVSYYFRPNVLNTASTGSSIMPCPWLSTSNITQNLLGSLCFVHDANFTALNNFGFSMDILYTYYFECKGAR